jgi:hypothetical protein
VIANKALTIDCHASTKTQSLVSQQLVKVVRWPWVVIDDDVDARWCRERSDSGVGCIDNVNPRPDSLSLKARRRSGFRLE